MNPGGAITTIDVREAERRLREDPERPLLIDVREPRSSRRCARRTRS